MRADEIVSKLLEDTLQEAAAKYLRVFGPEIPNKGYFFAGKYPAAHFVKQEVKDANFGNVSIDDYVAKFVRLGYTFVFSDGKNLTVQTSQKNLNFGNEAISAMENSLGLKPDSQVTWNGKTQAAAQLFYAQPDHASEPGRVSQPDQMQIGTFGGLVGSGQFQNVNRVDVQEIGRQLNNGYATVIWRPNGSVAVVTPSGFEFDDEAIQNLERTFKITPKKKVRWYNGSVKSDAGRDVDALYAVYGGKEPDPSTAPQGLAVPPPKI